MWGNLTSHGPYRQVSPCFWLWASFLVQEITLATLIALQLFFQVFQSDGSFVSKFGAMGSKPGNLEHPHYIAVSSSNRVIVSDSNNHRIQIFDVNGKVLTTFGSEGTDAGQFKFPRYVKCKFAKYIVVIFNTFYALWYFKLLTKFCCILQRSIRRRKRLHFCSRFRKQSHPNFQPRWNIP